MPLETLPEISLNYYLIAFDAQGNERTEPNGLLSQQLAALLSHEPITDVFIFSHGWLGDIPSAKNQYNNWIKAMASQHADQQNIQVTVLTDCGCYFLLKMKNSKLFTGKDFALLLKEIGNF